MAHIKVVLRKEVKKDGTLPLALRITKDRKTSYVYLDYSIKEADWDKVKQRVKKSHPNSVRLNNFLIAKLAEATESSISLETSKSDTTAQAVKQKIKPTSGGTLFAQADMYLARLKEDGKYTRHNSDQPRVKHLKAFFKQDCAFQDITIPQLERFKSYLRATYKMTERSAVNHLVVVRSIFSQAIKEGVCDPKYYPFGKGKIKIKFPDSAKSGLTVDEVEALETVELSQALNHARNVWLTSFYFAGMRISDVLRLKWSDIMDDRLHYTMGKNDKGGSLKVPQKAMAILAQYASFKINHDDLIFPELKTVSLNDKYGTQRAIASRNNALNVKLQQIASVLSLDKPLSMHIARHTFAQIAGDRIPIQIYKSFIDTAIFQLP